MSECVSMFSNIKLQFVICTTKERKQWTGISKMAQKSTQRTNLNNGKEKTLIFGASYQKRRFVFSADKNIKQNERLRVMYLFLSVLSVYALFVLVYSDVIQNNAILSIGTTKTQTDT